MPYDFEAIGFTPEIVARASNLDATVQLGGYAGFTQRALTDPSGAGQRYTLDPKGVVVCDEPEIMAGAVSTVWVTGAVPNPECPWCACLLAETRDPAGGTRTRLAFTASDLASTLPGWQREGPTRVRLAVFPHTLQTYSTDELYAQAQERANPGKPAWAIGSWLPDGLFGPTSTPFGSCTARVHRLTHHTNEHTGLAFALAHISVTPLGLNMVVPFTRDELHLTGLQPGYVVSVYGQVRAAYAGIAYEVSAVATATPWLAALLGLGIASGRVPGQPVSAPGAGEPPPPPPPPQPPRAFAPARRPGLVLERVLHAYGDGHGGAIGVAVDERATPRLFRAGVDGQVSWQRDLGGIPESLSVGSSTTVVVSADVVSVFDHSGRRSAVLARPRGVDVRWMATDHVLWALESSSPDPARGGLRRWTLHRVPRDRWTTGRPPDLGEISESWRLPESTGQSPDYRFATLTPGASDGSDAVVILPGGDGTGTNTGQATFARAPEVGPPMVFRTEPTGLPLAMLRTPAGDVITTREYTWVGPSPLHGAGRSAGPRTRWLPLSTRLVGGDVAGVSEYADEPHPTVVGVLCAETEGTWRWLPVESGHHLFDVRFALDADEPDRLVWTGVNGPPGARIALLDVETGNVRQMDLPGSVSLLAGSSSSGTVLVLEEPDELCLLDPQGRRVGPDMPDPGGYLGLDLVVRDAAIGPPS